MSAGKKENKLGMRASDTSEVRVRGLPRAGRSCSVRKGRASSTRCRCSTPAASASPRCRSASRRAPTRRRSATRRSAAQFGQPIAAFQAIQWKLADTATEIEAARLLTYRAAYLKDSGERMTRESAMAKLYASETAVRVADDACRSTAATAS